MSHRSALTQLQPTFIVFKPPLFFNPTLGMFQKCKVCKEKLANLWQETEIVNNKILSLFQTEGYVSWYPADVFMMNYYLVFGIFSRQISSTGKRRLMRTRLLNVLAREKSRMCTHRSTESIHELQQFKGHSTTKIDLSPMQKSQTWF